MESRAQPLRARDAVLRAHPDRNRTVAEVMAAQRTPSGCCSRFCDQMACECLEAAHWSDRVRKASGPPADAPALVEPGARAEPWPNDRYTLPGRELIREHESQVTLDIVGDHVVLRTGCGLIELFLSADQAEEIGCAYLAAARQIRHASVFAKKTSSS